MPEKRVLARLELHDCHRSNFQEHWYIFFGLLFRGDSDGKAGRNGLRWKNTPPPIGKTVCDLRGDREKHQALDGASSVLISDCIIIIIIHAFWRLILTQKGRCVVEFPRAYEARNIWLLRPGLWYPSSCGGIIAYFSRGIATFPGGWLPHHCVGYLDSAGDLKFRSWSRTSNVPQRAPESRVCFVNPLTRQSTIDATSEFQRILFNLSCCNL